MKRDFDSWVGTCVVCGKRKYTTRTAAKSAMKRDHPGDSKMNAYKCGDYWHLGHLPDHIKRRGLWRD